MFRICSPDLFKYRVVVLMFASQKKEDARIADERQKIKYQKEHMYDDLHTDENVQGSSNQNGDFDEADIRSVLNLL